MKFRLFLKDQLFALLIFAIALGIIILLCLGSKVSLVVILAIAVLAVVSFILTLLIAYFRKRTFYRNLLRNIASLDQAYLVLETLTRPEFYDGQILVDALYQINKSMHENVNAIRAQARDFREYIELWIHEIKAPLAMLTLSASELPSADRPKVQLELSRIENYLEQVLYYARSESAAEDFLIRPTNLHTVVKNVGVKNMNALLASGVDFIVENVDFTILTDAKWLEFILGQIVNNSLKYRRKIKHPYIKISAAQPNSNTTILTISDNGIGIPVADLPQVFDKSFTGTNGRTIGSSTGMGLYIAKRLCDNLGHEIAVTSQVNHSTVVKITFHRSEFLGIIDNSKI